MGETMGVRMKQTTNKNFYILMLLIITTVATNKLLKRWKGEKNVANQYVSRALFVELQIMITVMRS